MSIATLSSYNMFHESDNVSINLIRMYLWTKMIQAYLSLRHLITCNVRYMQIVLITEIIQMIMSYMQDYMQVSAMQIYNNVTT